MAVRKSARPTCLAGRGEAQRGAAASVSLEAGAGHDQPTLGSTARRLCVLCLVVAINRTARPARPASPLAGVRAPRALPSLARPSATATARRHAKTQVRPGRGLSPAPGPGEQWTRNASRRKSPWAWLPVALLRLALPGSASPQASRGIFIQCFGTPRRRLGSDRRWRYLALLCYSPAHSATCRKARVTASESPCSYASLLLGRQRQGKPRPAGHSQRAQPDAGYLAAVYPAGMRERPAPAVPRGNAGRSLRQGPPRPAKAEGRVSASRGVASLR